MNKINWKQKLSSRKFWAAVVGFVTALMVALAAYDGTISQVSAVNIVGGMLIANINCGSSGTWTSSCRWKDLSGI